MSHLVRIAYPHLVLDKAAVSCEPPDGWRLLDADGASATTVVRDGDVVEAWDALRTLHLTRTLNLKGAIASDLGLRRESARLAAVVVGTTGKGISRVVSRRVDLDEGSQTVDLDIQLPGDQLVRDLRLSVSLVVTEPGDGRDTLAPAVVGARVWEDQIRLQLEGGRPRLPIEAISFNATPAYRLFAKALFLVHVSPDGGLSVEDGLLVHLNADHQEFVKAVESRKPLATALLWAGVVRQIIREAIAQDIVAEAHGDAGSLSSTARRWIDQAFKGLSPDEVAVLASERPAEFDAAVESWCGSIQAHLREGQ